MTAIKVKTFIPLSRDCTGSSDKLDSLINNFIAENNIEVIDIKYSTAIFGGGQGTILSNWVPSAMLIYRERETSDTEEE